MFVAVIEFKYVSDSCRCDGEYSLTIYHHKAESPGFKTGKEGEERAVRYGHLSADDLDGDMIAYAEQSSEGKLHIICYNGKEIPATMIRPYHWKKKQDLIYLWISATDVSALGKSSKNQFEIPIVEVEFVLKYSYFDRLHKALDLLSTCTIQRLIPTSKNQFCSARESPSLQLKPRFREFLTLDYAQREALEAIVCAKPGAPVIVAGSFGTGKTQLLAQAAYQILEVKRTETTRPRVLVCAHHQASADAFLVKYFAPMIEKGWRVRMIRIIVRFRDKNNFDARYQKYCKVAREVSGSLHSYDLVVTTFANCLHLKSILKESSTGFFTHILVDEGAQTREPETIAPLFLSGPNTVIAIAGDHKQVGSHNSHEGARGKLGQPTKQQISMIL